MKENGDMNEVYGRVPLDLCSCKFGRNGDFSVYCSSSFVVLFLVGFVCVFALHFLKGICENEIK